MMPANHETMSAGVPTAAMDTSIVMATCSRAEMLHDALDSLLAQSWSQAHAVEIIVVDDGSTDGTAALLESFKRRSPIPFTIAKGPSRGIAAARNVGSRLAVGQWIASFDDDQIALPDWLAELRELAESSGAACVGGALSLQLPEGVPANSLGPRARSVLGEHLKGALPILYPAGSYPATNNVLIRRSVFEQFKGYDETYTEGGEDKDFFSRVSEAGHEIRFQPASMALHRMTPRRLTEANLRWTCLRLGASDARLERRRGSILLPMRLAAVRLGVLLLRDLPKLLASRMRRDPRETLDVRCSLWYTEGVLRTLPALFTSSPERSSFLRSVNFRQRNGERQDDSITAR